jgi:hypothetical protein
MPGILKVVGNAITRDGEPIVLKGVLKECVCANPQDLHLVDGVS